MPSFDNFQYEKLFKSKKKIKCGKCEIECKLGEGANTQYIHKTLNFNFHDLKKSTRNYIQPIVASTRSLASLLSSSDLK